MPTHTNIHEIAHTTNGSVRFEGGLYGANISFFLVTDAPGNPGPPLHTHPYSETWIVQAGLARFVAGELELEAAAGDVLVVEPNTPHKFRNVGDTTLELVCIHGSPKMIQTDLE